MAEVAGVLRAGAERGLLREFDEHTGARGRFEAKFLWLLPQPMRFVADVVRQRLSCPEMLDGIVATSALRHDLTAFLMGRHSAQLPEHRRVDSARCAIACPVRAGRLTLALDVLDGDWTYATEKLMKLVHETHVYLHRYWPGYAYESLGALLE
jgi:hypothetical protein